MTYGDTSNWGYPKMTFFLCCLRLSASWPDGDWEEDHAGRSSFLRCRHPFGMLVRRLPGWVEMGHGRTGLVMTVMTDIFFFRSDMSWFIILSDTLGFDAHQAFCWLNPRPRSKCIEVWRRYPTNRPSLIMPAKTCGWNPTRRECKQHNWWFNGYRYGGKNFKALPSGKRFHVRCETCFICSWYFMWV